MNRNFRTDDRVQVNNNRSKNRAQIIQYSPTRAGDEMGEWGQLDVVQQPPTAGVLPLHPVLTYVRSAIFITF